MTATSARPSIEDLAGRIFESLVGAMDLYAIYIGDKLGFYQALADSGPLTSHHLAERTGTAERYAREWLEQQAVTGILSSSPPRLGASRPSLQRTLSAVSERAPLCAVPCVQPNSNGAPRARKPGVCKPGSMPDPGRAHVLHTCHFRTVGGTVGHPCGRAAKALRDQGHRFEVNFAAIGRPLGI